jgi:hypothetical protein
MFVLAVGLAVARVGFLSQAAGVRLSADWAMVDFYSGAYYPVRALFDGENPHDRTRFMAVYPVAEMYAPFLPLTLLIHLPFALLPPRLGAVAFFCTTIVLTIVLARLVLQITGIRAVTASVIGVAALILLSRPGHWNLVLGQRAVEWTLATYIALAYARTAPLLAGAGVAVALIKPTYGLPLALLILARGYWRPVVIGGFIVTVVSIPILALFAQRAGGWEIFLDRLIAGYRTWQQVSDVNPATSIVRIDVTTTISRFLGHTLSEASQVALTMGVIAIAGAAVRLLAQRGGNEAEALSTTIICLALLLCGYHLGYDLVLLTWPFAMLLHHGLPYRGRRGVLWWVVVSLFALLALNWVTTESVLAVWQPTGALWLAIASLNGFPLLLLFGIYLWLILDTRRDVAPAYAIAG